MRRLAVVLVLVGCGSDAPPPEVLGPPPSCEREPALDAAVTPGSHEYAYSCEGVVPATEEPPIAEAADDCTTGIWPDLDDTFDLCPTVSDAMRTDPVSGKALPSSDGRSLPVEIPVTESGSFLPADLPAGFSAELRVVAWNMEYTTHLDAQIEVLTTHPDLALGDVYLLSEVDRCSHRNGVRRAARLLAEAIGGAYVYGIEFVELDIGRLVGGDTGQAIVARRPLTGARLGCHSRQSDWFASESEPRLGQRVFLHADVPVGETFVRLWSLHFESNDLFGEKRSVQAKELLDVAQSTACERPQIVAGDFNAPYCGAPELEVFRKSGYVDALALAGDEGPTRGGLRLDYVLARGFRVVAGAVVRDLGLSDHDPQWVDLVLE